MMLKGTHPQISPDDIGVRQVLENFELRRTFEWDAWKLKNEQLFNVPDLLNSHLRNTTFVTGLVRRAKFYSRRLILDHILVSCIIAEAKGTVVTELIVQSQTASQEEPARMILMFGLDMGPLSALIES